MMMMMTLTVTLTLTLANYPLSRAIHTLNLTEKVVKRLSLAPQAFWND